MYDTKVGTYLTLKDIGRDTYAIVFYAPFLQIRHPVPPADTTNLSHFSIAELATLERNTATMTAPRFVVLCLAFVVAIATAFSPSEPPSANSKWSPKISTYAPMKRVGFATPRELACSDFGRPPSTTYIPTLDSITNCSSSKNASALIQSKPLQQRCVHVLRPQGRRHCVRRRAHARAGEGYPIELDEGTSHPRGFCRTRLGKTSDQCDFVRFCCRGNSGGSRGAGHPVLIHGIFGGVVRNDPGGVGGGGSKGLTFYDKRLH